MRLVCLSDTHSKHKQVEVPDGDVLIHAGDLTPRGNYNEFMEVANWFRSIRRRFKYRIMIAGNHDWGLEINRNIILMLFDNDVIYLQDNGIEIEGIKFWGSPWCPQFYDWAFMKEDHELLRYWQAIPDDTQILITHCPPHSILDRNDHDDRCGSKTLYERIKQLNQLKHHIFGHIHKSYGQETIGNVIFHNVASLNENYCYQNPAQVIDL